MRAVAAWHCSVAIDVPGISFPGPGMTAVRMAPPEDPPKSDAVALVHVWTEELSSNPGQSIIRGKTETKLISHDKLLDSRCVGASLSFQTTITSLRLFLLLSSLSSPGTLIPPLPKARVTTLEKLHHHAPEIRAWKKDSKGKKNKKKYKFWKEQG